MPILSWTFVIEIVILIYSVVLHELAHGYTARAMGDPTAEEAGRLTLNPLAHLDMFGSFILPIITSFFGFMFGYAKPVPYDPSRLDDRVWGPAKVGLAGPAVNLVLAALFGLVIRVWGPAFSPVVLQLLSYVVSINLVLAFFNLMPIPPLDGHWLLVSLLPGSSTGRAVLHFMYANQWVLFAVAIFVLFPLLMPLVAALYAVFTGLPVAY